jgi:electron transport complex protein RnfB
MSPPPSVALIGEAACIGCALCLEACPVDAIVGAPRRMHTVIAAECIGCRLCLPPCPVDCITMVDTGKALTREERRLRAARARRRYLGRIARRRKLAAAGRPAGAGRKRETVERALQRARARLREKS